jgi:predicted flap endonuclease-1-like 5' DNA nuclease
MGPATDNDAKQVTVAVTWGIAGLVGVLACIMLFIFADVGITGAIFLAAILAAVVGFVLQWGMKDLPPLGSNVGAASTPKPSVPEPAAPTPAPAAAHPPVSAETGVKPTTPLPGQAELASRKGSWKYEAEGADAGTKPETLKKARGGKADDFKKMKGVGPKLAEALNAAGIYHFDQIASWSAAEVAWVEENVDGARGRVSRDDWVSQAKELAK